MPEKSRDDSAPYLPAIRLPTGFNLFRRKQTRVIRHRLTREQTQRVHEIVAQKRVSVHGLLSALALIHLGKTHGMDELTLLSNVEFRDQCTPDPGEQTVGCYIDIIRTRHRTDLPLWSLASRIMFGLVTTLARNRAGASVLKLPTFEFYRREGWDTLRTGMRLDAITVTSANDSGIRSRHGAIRLRDMSICVSLATVGASYFLVSMEREGALDIHLCYTVPCVSDAMAHELLAAISEGLEGL